MQPGYNTFLTMFCPLENNILKDLFSNSVYMSDMLEFLLNMHYLVIRKIADLRNRNSETTWEELGSFTKILHLVLFFSFFF